MHISGDALVHTAADTSGDWARPHLTSLNYAGAYGGPKAPIFDDPSTEVLRQRGHEHEAAITQVFQRHAREEVSAGVGRLTTRGGFRARLPPGSPESGVGMASAIRSSSIGWQAPLLIREPLRARSTQPWGGTPRGDRSREGRDSNSSPATAHSPRCGSLARRRPGPANRQQRRSPSLKDNTRDTRAA